MSRLRFKQFIPVAGSAMPVDHRMLASSSPWRVSLEPRRTMSGE
ncbi:MULTISPECIES: hypothetical protein [Pseudomonas]|nr:hypothetical protein [Pseudomonas sp. D1HM]